MSSHRKKPSLGLAKNNGKAIVNTFYVWGEKVYWSMKWKWLLCSTKKNLKSDPRNFWPGDAKIGTSFFKFLNRSESIWEMSFDC